MAGSQRIDCIDELKELQINGCEQVNLLKPIYIFFKFSKL